MDRRFLLGVALMIVIALAPSILFKKAPQPATLPSTTLPVGRSGGPADSSATPTPTVGAARDGSGTEAPPARPPARLSAAEDTVVVNSPLYRYAFSTRGGRLIGATLNKYHSTVKADASQPLEILPSDASL